MSKEEKEKLLVDKVVEVLKPQLKTHVESIRADLINDFKELLEKQNVPKPNIESPGQGVDVSKLMKGLQEGNLDMSSISKMINSVQQPAPVMTNNGKPIDINDLTPGQVEFMKMERQQANMTMMMQNILPMILQNQAGGSGMNAGMAELFNRSMMSGVMGDQYMKKMMFSILAKKSETPDVYNQYSKMHDNLFSPVEAMLNAGSTGGAQPVK